MTKPVPLCNNSAVQLRFLCPEDLGEVKHLCAEWFPIEYPEQWYKDITSSSKFYSLAAVYNHIIIGLIVAEIKAYGKSNKEDQGMLSPHSPAATQVAYILSLGVVKEHRRNGIASLLLDSLISHLTSHSPHCKAIYLHVLTTNRAAIQFYEERHFRLHSFLPYYYSIQGKARDGFSYVLYINGGSPPWSVIEYAYQLSGVLWRWEICSLPQRVVRAANAILRRILPDVSRIVHSATAMFS